MHGRPCNSFAARATLRLVDKDACVRRIDCPRGALADISQVCRFDARLTPRHALQCDLFRASPSTILGPETARDIVGFAATDVGLSAAHPSLALDEFRGKMLSLRDRRCKTITATER